MYAWDCFKPSCSHRFDGVYLVSNDTALFDDQSPTLYSLVPSFLPISIKRQSVREPITSIHTHVLLPDSASQLAESALHR